MAKIKTKIWLFALVLSFLGMISRGFAQVSGSKNNLRQSLEPILTDPDFANFNLQQFTWREQRAGHIVLPDENPNHEEGVFWMRDFDVATPLGNPPRVYAYGTLETRVLNGHYIFPTEDDARQVGLKFLKRQFAWFFRLGKEPTGIVTEPKVNAPPSRKGVWEFQWRQLDEEGLPAATADVKVRAIDGKIVGFAVRRESWPEHKVKLPQAKEVALRIASQDSKYKDIKVTSAIVIPADLLYSNADIPKVIFRLVLEAIDSPTGRVKVATVHVDATAGKLVWINPYSGKPIAEKIIWNDKDSQIIETNLVPEDRFPTWTKHGLVFGSLRKLVGMPNWATVPPQVFLQDKSGNVTHLTSDLATYPAFVSGLPSTSWITIERQGWSYALDLNTGSYRVLGQPERPGRTPTIDSTGRWAMVFGTGHDANSDVDLMSDDLQRSENLALRGRLVLHGSYETNPLFSPDGKWVYFISSKEDEGQASHSLQRMTAEVALTKEIKPITPEQVQTIAKLSEEVERISFFPDGARVLLQNRKGMFIVSVPEGKVTPVAPKEPKDAEVGAPVTETRDGWAGPGDERVTFSGKTTDKDGQTRWRIYSVRLDGSDLQAHTPKDNEPVPMYQFPESQKTAYDLAKEWALNEIKYEQAHKER